MKNLSIKVISNSSRDEILLEKERYKIYLKAKAVHNEANKSLIKLLSSYFNVNKSNIRIIKGERSNNKIVRID